MNESTSNRIKVNIYAFLTILLWGSGFPFTRVIGDEISPYSLSFIRCALAAVILLVIGKACHIRKPFCRKNPVCSGSSSREYWDFRYISYSSIWDLPL